MEMLGILRHLVPTSQTAAHKATVATNHRTAEGIAERSPLRPLPKLSPTAVSPTAVPESVAALVAADAAPVAAPELVAATPLL